jgi:hypothetical protein
MKHIISITKSLWWLWNNPQVAVVEQKFYFYNGAFINKTNNRYS